MISGRAWVFGVVAVLALTSSAAAQDTDWRDIEFLEGGDTKRGLVLEEPDALELSWERLEEPTRRPSYYAWPLVLITTSIIGTPLAGVAYGLSGFFSGPKDERILVPVFIGGTLFVSSVAWLVYRIWRFRQRRAEYERNLEARAW